MRHIMKTDEIKSQPPVLLTRRQAAALLGCDYGTLATWKYTKRYDLPCIKVGKSAMYKYSDVIEFLERNTTRQIEE